MNVHDSDLHQVHEDLNKIFQKKHRFHRILYRYERLVKIENLFLVKDDISNIIYKGEISFTKKKKTDVKGHRNYYFILYRDQAGFDLYKQDRYHIGKIRDLALYPLKHTYAFKKKHFFNSPMLVIEEMLQNDTIALLRKPLDLTNTRWVNQKINRYLQERFFIKKQGYKLLRKNEKFNYISETHSLSHGLNNVVYKIDAVYKSRAGISEIRSYVLRVSPNNSNRLKIVNEAHRLKKIKKELVPNPTLYIYEDRIRFIGYRFMIQELMPGNSVIESLPNFTTLEAKEFLTNLAHILGSLHSKRSKKYDSYYIKDKTTKKYSFANYIMMELKRTLRNFKELKLDKELDIDTTYLYKWCKGHRPLLNISTFSLIHGDIRPSNILTVGSKISGLIDWEMSCYSDPAQDIGWSLFFFKLYPNLKEYRGHFFSEYWKMGNKFDIEARVYFYEVLAAIKLFTYTKYVELKDSEKFVQNQDFFQRVKTLIPNYVERITHRD